MPANNLNILVADDDQLVRQSTARHLRAQGFQVTSVSNGADALIHLNSGRFDLALLDLAMPKLSGREVVERLQESGRDLPLVITSGYEGELQRFSQDFDSRHATIRKPYRMFELHDLIGSTFKRSTQN